MGSTKYCKEDTIEKIKKAIEAGSFKIGEKVYTPLHTTSYLLKILKELEDDKFLVRKGTLVKVLWENGLTHPEYAKMKGKANAYHQNTTCFEVLKNII